MLPIPTNKPPIRRQFLRRQVRAPARLRLAEIHAGMVLHLRRDLVAAGLPRHVRRLVQAGLAHLAEVELRVSVAQEVAPGLRHGGRDSLAPFAGQAVEHRFLRRRCAARQLGRL